MNRQKPLDFEISPGAKSFFKSIKKNKPLLKKFQEAIEVLRLDPTLGDDKKGDLSGVSSFDIRHNKTSYELAYCVEEQENGDLLLIVLAGTRENFYDELKKYIKKSGMRQRIPRK
ncbi:plasmid stabilization system [Bacillus methanolicus PB1]|uniref:Plasmid stabilization system n=1 Tax=Bacillus methanolicus PB1 TaxID=997296 RepID=I3E256_BACMT|nr:type II toxin-antitoxin system RelE/ParE family toxin [Bacillus methanolicus]EIJ80577.1 plasmid stabilization system [Bacillus methanolicus PB1]